MALSLHVPVRFFRNYHELLPPAGLSWSHDQDLEQWGRAIWRGRRRPLGTLAADSIGLYCLVRPRHRIFPFEANILHDFCAMVVPWAFADDVRDGFVKFLTEDVVASDIVLCDSHSTKADAAWFSPLDPERAIVAYPGPSLCVETHCHRDQVARSDRIGLVVSTIEPRKNARFLLEWFQQTTVLPHDMELWWVGKRGSMISPAELERMTHPLGGRRVRFLENVCDAELCRLYQIAGWTIYPSHYEGFGFPVLDSLRHGTPVLSSSASSLGEFDHPGVFFFDPNDPATVDLAWQRLQEAQPVTIPQARLDELYSWDLLARTLLDAHARGIDARAGRQPRCAAAGFRGVESATAGAGSVAPMGLGPEGAAPAGVKPHAVARIGIGLFGTQTISRNLGIGRFTRSLVAALLAGDHDSQYVLYAQHGLPTDQIATAPNAVLRLLRPDETRGEATLAQALDRLITANPDGLDVLVLLNPTEMAPGFDVPVTPSNGLRLAAIIYDLIPFLFDERRSSGSPGPERVRSSIERLGRMGGYDALLAISEAARRELLSLLNVPPDRVVAIGTASDGRYFVPDRGESMPAESRSLFRTLGISGAFVLSVGTMEYQRRNNLPGLIEAFAKLPPELRETHQLVMTYALWSEGRKRVRQWALDRGVADRIVITDRLGDKAMRALYQRCAAFVSLTSYEELGLPILEAMHCGAPVVVGNTAAQMELIGDAGLCFHVTDPAALADRLVQVLGDSRRARQLGEHAVVQAGHFHWDKTAAKVVEALCRSHSATGAQSLASDAEATHGGAMAANVHSHSAGTGTASPAGRPFFRRAKADTTKGIWSDPTIFPPIGRG
jgi:glycosyltransferase involved in cell wall biosynthesis